MEGLHGKKAALSFLRLSTFGGPILYKLTRNNRNTPCNGFGIKVGAFKPHLMSNLFAMKYIFTFSIFFFVVLGHSQTINIAPTTFNEDEEITITISNFDPTATFGSNSIYLWAWYFDTDGDFGGNSPQTGNDFNNSPATALFTDNGDGTFSYTLTPTTFYAATNIGTIGFLLKNQNGSQQTADNLVPVGRFQVNLTDPGTDQTILNAGEMFTVSATATEMADFTLSSNGNPIDTATGTTHFTSSFVVSESSNFLLEASNGTETQRFNFSVLVPPTVTEVPLPPGLQDGLNRDPNDPTRATLVLFAPDKEFIHIIGDFTNWEVNDAFLMNRDSTQDRFWLELTGLTPQFDHLYQYLIDGTIRIPDPYSEIVLDEFNDPFINENGNTVYPDLPSYPTADTDQLITLMRVGDPEFAWTTPNFVRPEMTDLVIYELLIRDFDPLHSFEAVIDRLDYLVDLGINAIELMPISEFDGNLSWGYNTALHMALDKYYGNPEALKRFVDACHARGIAVILDVVYNHATGQHPYFRMYNECGGDFNCAPSANNPFFNAVDPNTVLRFFNDLDHESTATQEYLDRINRYWIEEFHIDGYRFDFTKGFTNTVGNGDGFDQSRINILTRMYDHIRTFNQDAYVILEHFAPNEELTALVNYRTSVDPNEEGMLVWSNHNFNYNEATLGFHSNGGSDFSFISHRNRNWDTPSNVSYMESHDEERLMYKNLRFGNSSESYNVQDFDTALTRQQLAGAFFFTVPGPKLIWQFGELGYDLPINRCEDGTIDESCRTSPKPIPFSLGYDTDIERTALYEQWSDLIALKLREPIFTTDDFTIDARAPNGLKKIQLTDTDPENGAIRYITIVGNFGVTDQNIDPDFQETGTWYDLLNGNRPLTITDTNAPINLAPGAFMVLADQSSLALIDPNDLDSDGVSNANDLCPNTPFGATVNVDGCEIFTLPISNFTIQTLSESCRSSDNGGIEITAEQTLNYVVTLIGDETNDTFNFTQNLSISNLPAGNYQLCIQVENETDYEQCFSIAISQPEILSVTTVTDINAKSITLLLDGSSNYQIDLNGKVFNTTASTFTLDLDQKENHLEVRTALDCQGAYEETIFVLDAPIVYPNPVGNELLFIALDPPQNPTVTMALYDYSGRTVTQKTIRAQDNVVTLNMDTYTSGQYILSITVDDIRTNYSILKR